MSEISSSLSRLEIMEDFYQENKDKLLINVSHPINETNFIEWIERHHDIDTNLGILASDFRRYTTHISLGLFMDQIGKISAHIRSLVMTEKYVNVILFFSGVQGAPVKFEKSNTWVTILFYGYLSDIITDIKFVHVNETDEKTLIILADDASYSGSQYASVVDTLLKYTNHNQDIMVAIPYISKKAKNKIKKKKLESEKIQPGKKGKLIFSNETETIYSIEENIELDEKSTERKMKEQNIDTKKKMWRDLTDIGYIRYTMYFDHKLADGLSTYTDTYALGNPLHIQRCKDNWGVLPLIGNCNEEQTEAINRFRCKRVEPETDVGWEKACPSPFYKGIEYKYKGVVVKSLYDVFP